MEFSYTQCFVVAAMLGTFEFSTERLLKAKPRKLLIPALWLVLLTIFIRAAINHSTSRIAAVGGSWVNSSSDLPHMSIGDGLPTSKSEKQPPTANITTSDKVAVIIETRRSGNIVPLILHFSAVLGPTWPVIIYTPAENFGSFSTSAALLRHQRSGRIIVRPLAEGVYFWNWNSVSAFLTTRWLWDDLAPAEHILMFQSDSMLCANAARSVEEFFEYDFIGAPIDPQYGVGYNGGLSMRSRKTTLRVLEEFDWSKGTRWAEDQWFYAKLKELQEQEIEEGIENGINLPSMEIARTFAVETIDHPYPLGLHQPTRFIHSHMVSLDEWCPEYKMATMERIQ
ncbi:hypothetical protein CJF31_00004862 [Rutstroemia sp. NJR-2017a BVV2]|nr:hypothetical protein CJF31_00004862 [Rutstroemia sp. NJR-2017a BVV2]